MTGPLTGIVLAEDVEFSLRDVCEVCGVHAEVIIDMVNEGVADPRSGVAPREWRFTGVTVNRVQRALRLQRDLHVNLAGAALALDLMDELEYMRRLCRRLGG